MPKSVGFDLPSSVVFRYREISAKNSIPLQLLRCMCMRRSHNHSQRGPWRAPGMLSADQTKGRLHTFLAPSWHFTQTQTPRVLCTEVHRALLLAVTPAHAATRGALPGDECSAGRRPKHRDTMQWTRAMLGQLEAFFLVTTWPKTY